MREGCIVLGDAFRYPLRGSATREASAYAIGALLAAAVLFRFAAGLWPSWTALLPIGLATVPAVLFVGHLAAILRNTAATSNGGASAESTAETTSSNDATTLFRLTGSRVRLGVRALAVSSIYLFFPGVLLAVGGYLIASGTIPDGAVGLVASIVATVALLVVVSFAYLLPGAVAVSARHGVRHAFRRSALRGLTSGSYFVAWTGAIVLAVLGWGAVSLTTPGTIGGFVAVVWFTYTHLTGARLLGCGLAGIRGR